MTSQEATELEAWKRQAFSPDQLMTVETPSEPHTYFCGAMVRESTTVYRRCHAWTFGIRAGHPVCSAHYHSRTVTFEKED